MVMEVGQKAILILVGQQMLKGVARHQRQREPLPQLHGATVGLLPRNRQLAGQFAGMVEHRRHQIHTDDGEAGGGQRRARRPVPQATSSTGPPLSPQVRLASARKSHRPAPNGFRRRTNRD
ncbi:MAG: hypothetical protein R2932_17485 [Caldilineaceae bacterium]